MKRGFLAIAWDAILVCENTDQKGCVMDLYQLADRHKWQPFQAGEAYLSLRWNKSRRFVRALISALEAAGCLQVLNAGGRRCAKTIRIQRTINVPKVNHKRTKTKEVKPQQNKEPVPKVNHKRTISEHILQDKKRKEERQICDSEIITAVWSEHLKHHKGNKTPPAYAKKAINAAFRSIGPSEVGQFVLLVRAANLSDHPLFARDIRAEGWSTGTDRSGSLDTILRHDKLAMRIQAAQEWSGSEVAATEFNKIKMALRGHPLDISEQGLKALKKIGGMTTLGRCKDLTDLKSRYLLEYNNQKERQT